MAGVSVVAFGWEVMGGMWVLLIIYLGIYLMCRDITRSFFGNAPQSMSSNLGVRYSSLTLIRTGHL